MSLYRGYFVPNGVDPSGSFAINLKFSAFIPTANGMSVRNNPLAAVKWLYEPGQTYIWYPYMFSTDNRDKAGEAGTSRLKTLGYVESAKIGNLEGAKYTKSFSDPSHQIQVSYRAGQGWSPFYLPGTLRQKTAKAPGRETVVDIKPCAIGDDQSDCLSVITVSAEGTYPFRIGPPINYTVKWFLKKECGQVSVRSEGSHNLFPAYENIANTKLLYSDPVDADEGPGLWNLGILWKTFSTEKWETLSD